MFNVGEVYSRVKLHATYGGQPHTRISTPAEHDLILLFASHSVLHNPNSNGYYTSGWTQYGIFRFVGEGRYGHMSFTRGNRALRDHLNSGKQIHLFTRSDSQPSDRVQYEGEFVYRGHFYKEGLDQRRDLRRMIVFVLKPRHAHLVQQPATSVRY